MAQLIPAPVISKTPGERRIVEIDWSAQLPEAVVISGSTWAVTGDVTMSLTAQAIAGVVTRVRVDGGTIDAVAQITNLVELSNGERIESCITVYVRSACVEAC
jgi:hypothetical protein